MAHPERIPSSHAMPGASHPSGSRPGAGWILWVLPLIAFANAAAYVAYAGNPLVASDAWYFVSAFLEKAMDSGPALEDFFVKRDGADHAQPLVKLLMWGNAEWFGLDFVFEAIIGLIFALLMFIILKRSLPQGRSDLVGVLGVGSLALVLMTLNAGMVFNWSLVTMTYLVYFLAVAAYAAAWRLVATERGLPWMLASAFLVAFAMDDVGLIVSLSIAIASVAAAVKLRRWSGAAKVLASVTLAELCYFGFVRIFLAGSAGVVPDQLGNAGIGALLARVTDAPEIARIVFGSTLAHIHTLTYYVADAAARLQGLLAAVALLAHGWFWWQAWKTRWTPAVFHAVAIMLLFYGMLAGILISRLPGYGVNYLHEPRYAVFYLLSNVALVLMLIGRKPSGVDSAGPGRMRVLAPVALACLAALQVPLSWFTWRDGTYLYSYYHTMAAQMYALGDGSQVSSCVPLLTVCQMQGPERKRLLDFLERERLNVYSPAFIERYRLRKLAPAEATRPTRGG